MALPTELVDSLNQTYFLHLLINDKDKVVPPGKSVLSMLMHSNFRLPQESDKPSDLVERVKDVAHKLFWREATEVLSSPMPFVQLPRLKGLYLDLHEALESLFPPNHRILMTLAAPPPPTSSPLLSTVNLLKEILVALRERSAPIRDEQIDALLSTVSLPPAVVQRSIPPESSLSRSPEVQLSPLAQFVIDNIRAILSLVGDMKSDLNNYILGSMTEEQLLDVLSTETESREREFVLKLWGDKEELHDLWLSWSKAMSPQDKVSEFADYSWTNILYKALEADRAVFCVPPKHVSSTIPNGTTQSMTNCLPPQLFFVIPALVYLQNYIQAVIITAALQILARPPYSATQSLTVPSSSAPTSRDIDLRHDFVQHIWTLLKAEIDTDRIDKPSFDDTSNNIPETKLINLADEVVHERRKLGNGWLNLDEEMRLRDAVDRTLRTSDPVFLVLRKRLFGALEGKLLDTIGRIQQDVIYSTKLAIPARMQTGRRPPTESQKRVVASSSKAQLLGGGAHGARTDVRFEVLGFDHAVLRNAVAEAYEKLVRCIFWTARVWGDDLKNESRGGIALHM